MHVVHDGTDGTRALRLALRIAAGMLATGAQTDDVESAIGGICRGLGLHGVQAAVSFSTISVSWQEMPGDAPTTMLRLVRDKGPEYARLADLAELARRLERGELDVTAGEAALEALAERPSTYGRVVTFVAPGASAAGATVMFSGSIADAVATLLIAFVVQPPLVALDRSGLPPFFRLVFGAAATTILVAIVVGLGGPVSGGLVLTGSLLRFLPGYALVSGFRDLVDQSIVSGTARLAEALLLGAAVAGGTALAVAVADAGGVQLSIQTAGVTDWTFAYTAIAAFVAVAAYAIRLDVPRHAILAAATIGAVGWLGYTTVTPPIGRVDPGVATLATSIAIGVVGRLLARRTGAPAALWVVPAILPLLPGLQIVTAMLAVSDLAQITGLIDAAVTAFLIGVGVASGDIVVLAVRGVRDRVVAPAFGAVAGGVEVLISGGARPGPRDPTASPLGDADESRSSRRG